MPSNIRIWISPSKYDKREGSAINERNDNSFLNGFISIILYDSKLMVLEADLLFTNGPPNIDVLSKHRQVITYTA